jgi:hypothetical protein
MDEIRMEDVKTRIFKMRGHQVMLDSDLALLYDVSTKRLNEQVKRNIRRFPQDFMFRLSIVEVNLLRSQIATSKTGRGGRRYMPLVFTEQGVAMLSTALTSERAIQVNIAIMRAFVKLRHALANSRYLTHKVEKMEGRLYLVETDIRLILNDVGQLKERFNPQDPIPPTILE